MRPSERLLIHQPVDEPQPPRLVPEHADAIEEREQVRGHRHRVLARQHEAHAQVPALAHQRLHECGCRERISCARSGRLDVLRCLCGGLSSVRRAFEAPRARIATIV